MLLFYGFDVSRNSLITLLLFFYMRILLVGDGGALEHILVEQLSRSAEVRTATFRRNPAILRAVSHSFIGDIENIEAIGNWAIKEKVDLALVVSEEALRAGLSDALALADIPVASPGQTAATIGWDKQHAFRIMEAAKISHPKHMLCKNLKELQSHIKNSRKFVLQPPFHVDPLAIKIFTNTQQKEAVAYGKKLLRKYKGILLEEFVDGEGFVLQAFSDGTRLSVMPPVKVRKYAEEGDKGPITPGMGCYSAGKLLPFLSNRDLEIAKEMLTRCVHQLKKHGESFHGIFSGEFLLTRRGVRLLTITATLGNPEALSTLSLLRTELAETLFSIHDGNLKPASFFDQATVVKYMVPKGYPSKPKAKQPVDLDDRSLWNTGAKFYIESLDERAGKFFTTKDRTFALFSKANTIEQAERNVERAIQYVQGPLIHRKDIATLPAISRSFKRLQVLRGI